MTAWQRSKIGWLARALTEWSRREGRQFPWRSKDASTYQKVAVEVLLQRTTAAAVAGFYERFFARYPDWASLAAARDTELEEFLKPLGLWRRRAASLLGLAGYARDNRGTFPVDPAQHASIPAVGQYVSNAILVFQEGQAAPLLDVNMARVLERVVRPRRLADIRYDPWLQSAAAWLVRGDQPEQVNWAVLDFAALVCKARVPLCEACPVSGRCAYYRAARVSRPRAGAQATAAVKSAGDSG